MSVDEDDNTISVETDGLSNKMEVVARIPAHTPEWTNPRIGDPGRTLIDLFAWLTDTLLYRANLDGREVDA